jgi:LuxR family maltose regulon positive regulatory protein
VETETSDEILAQPLAEWKLAPMLARSGVVPRPRLFALLDRQPGASLTLIAAPAGYGKTQLLASWIEARPDISPAWVSLDAADGEPRRFWTYVATAVDRVRPGMALPALRRLRTPGVPLEEAIDELLNAIATFTGRLVIVIDDLHHFASSLSAHTLAYAVDHLPPAAQIVAATRSDPVVSMGRLRALGAVSDIRADQLAFTLSEARDVIIDRIGVDLALSDLELLVNRTEGWPAGVGLAGLWLSEAEDPGRLVQSFSGQNRQIADYLVEEVLDSLDGETRRLLVQASILERLSGALCDVVLGVEGSGERLEALAQSNLFVIPVDRRGEWYRLHQLLRDLLALELSREDEEVVRDLHERAAGWFVEHDLLEEAFEHAAAAGDPSTVARLLADRYLALIRSNRVDLFLRWLEWLPREVLVDNPMLPSAGVLALIISGQPLDERSERLLGIAQSGVPTQPPPVQLRVAVTAELARTGVLAGDLAESVRSGRRAVELALGGDEELIAGAHAMLAYALYLQGDNQDARAEARAAIERPEAPERPHALIYALASTALVELEEGHLQAAETTARRSLEIARRLGLAAVAAAGLARLAMGQVLLESGDVAEAERHLERAETLRRASRPTLEHIHAVLQLARARLARGRLHVASTEIGAALEELDSFSDAGRLTGLAEQVTQALNEALATAKVPFEPPTASELPVLRLLATDLTQRQIAQELYLSHNTVKSHSRNLYRKLGATTRAEAVRRAAELELLT